MKKFLIILLAISLCLMAASLTLAADTKGKTTTTTKTTVKTTSNEGKLGIGWFDTNYTWGISANYRLNNTLSVQGIVAPLGLGFYGAKANYKFLTPDPSIGVYGYGMAGLSTFAGLSFGGGAGVEWFPGKMFDLGNDNYKKVGFMAELGVGNFADYHYDWDNNGNWKTFGEFGLTFNAAMHYYF